MVCEQLLRCRLGSAISAIKSTWKGRDAEDQIHLSDWIDTNSTPRLLPAPSHIRNLSLLKGPQHPPSSASSRETRRNSYPSRIPSGQCGSRMDPSQPSCQARNRRKCGRIFVAFFFLPEITQPATTETIDQQNAQQDPRSPYRGCG